MSGLIMAAQLIAGLSILVVIHELGHYLAARAFGIRVEKFYLFFDAWKFRLFRFKKGDTEYGIGWLPLGGYVKIAGMIDESMDKEQMKKPPQAWEFRSKPAWQRLIVMVAGVVMNVILGVILFAFVTYHYEQTYLPNDALKDGIYAYETGREIGFETGDKIVSVNGKKIERFKDVLSVNVYMGATLTVERNGNPVDIIVPDTLYRRFKDRNVRDFFIDANNFPCLIDSVFPGMAAYQAPLHKSDHIIAVDSVRVDSQEELQAALFEFSGVDAPVTIVRQNDTLEVMVPVSEAGVRKTVLQKGDEVYMIDSVPVASYGVFRELVWNSKGKTISMHVLRGGDSLATSIFVDSTGYIGVACKKPYENRHYSLGSAITYGFSDAMGNLWANMRGLGKIFTGKENASESLQGPIGIAKIYGGVWNWHSFWFITGLLSMILALMNILPIPALDGGHVIFTTIELVTGRKFSDKFMERAQVVGMIILLSIMAFAIGNDIWKSIF
jgi:regulator of sigma E protease